MTATRKVLLLGGTGAMGANLSQLLMRNGWNVTVTSRSRSGISENGIAYARGNAHDPAFLKDILSGGWDAVVDFMVWSTAAFASVRDVLLSSCTQYVYLSSYRVFADVPVITEDSPRLLDVSGDTEYLSTDEYALAKARQEDLLREADSANWTIVRPAITYDRSGRFQLCTLESEAWLRLALTGHAVPLASEMLPKQTTMSWGGDVARMISGLIGNATTLGEDYNVCTSKHQSWAEVIEIYQSLVNLRVREVSLKKFEHASGSVYQCRYDRMFHRVMDNSKVLKTIGLVESDFTGVKDGLSRELEIFLRDPQFRPVSMQQLGRLDYLGGGLFTPATLRHINGASLSGYVKYYVGRIFI